MTDCICGRVNFVTDEGAGTWDENELEGLLKKHSERPDRYVAHHNESTVSVSSIGIVWGCDCGMSLRYENFLINNESSILSYYKKIQQMRAHAHHDLKQRLEAITGENNDQS